MTPFRATQARAVLAGALRTLAPCMSVELLHDVAELLVYDRALWVELEQLHQEARLHPESSHREGSADA